MERGSVSLKRVKSGEEVVLLEKDKAVTLGRAHYADKRCSREQIRLRFIGEGTVRVECLGTNGAAYVHEGNETALRKGQTCQLGDGDVVWLLNKCPDSAFEIVFASAVKRQRVVVATAALVLHEVSRLALGTLALGVTYPDNKRPSWEQGKELVHVALDEGGVQLIDTSDCYCRDGSEIGYVERLLGEALANVEPGRVYVATKGGMGRRVGDETSSSWINGNTSPEGTKANIRRSYEALGNRRIDLWQVHHPPSDVAKLVACMKAAYECTQEDGLVRHLGLCNVGVAQIRAVVAAGVPIVSVQNKFSIWHKTAASPMKNANGTGETGVLDYCSANGITFIAYSPLGGLNTRRGDWDLTKQYPRIAAAAAKRKCNPYQLLLALMRVQWPKMILLVGTRDKEKIRGISSSVDAIASTLTMEEAKDLWSKK